ncbi:MAG: anthranilate phosphoribosyltransferase [Firmicutes bacterium]|nr:anthranilate phosphoribosyltransferase [Bacillota bacterium]
MIQHAVKKLLEHENLSEAEAFQVMEEIMRGETLEIQMTAFLIALRMKGETAAEIAGCAKAMRAESVKVNVKKDNLVDTCGTGGDCAHTFNISTLSALVAAGAGVRVAKHGNRSVSSKCGSADLLQALGVEISPELLYVERAIEEIGIGFLFAPHFHPAMKHCMGVRKELGVRTIFNILGPLTNPAGANAQIMGVYDPELCPKLAEVLGVLGVRRAMVFNGDGLDELTTTGINHVSELKDGAVKSYELSIEELGISPARRKSLEGGSIDDNVKIARSVLKGEKGARRDVVLLNSAAALVVGGAASDMKDGIKEAAHSIDSGLAWEKLEKLIEYSRK